MNKEYESRPLKIDPLAKSKRSGQPTFISKPKGAPVYHGFSLIEETRTDGWCFGAITEFEDPNGCDSGDGFVETPKGERAGIVWDVGNGNITEILPPKKERWGVYQVWFPRIVKTVEDLVFNFRCILPELKGIYAKVKHLSNNR
jgi:hypothetical protein